MIDIGKISIQQGCFSFFISRASIHSRYKRELNYNTQRERERGREREKSVDRVEQFDYWETVE